MIRVLVVEPDASARHATIALVRSVEADLAVDGVARLEQIWPAIERLKPQLLIVDPAPYGPHGELLLSLFRETYPAARVLVLTSTSAARRSVRGLPADIVAEKRLSPSRLRDIIRDALEERSTDARA